VTQGQTTFREMVTEYPFKIVPVPSSEYEDDPETKNAHHLFHKLRHGFDRYGPQRFVVRAGQQEILQNIYNMEVTERDVWVVTYPRSGTTWTQEMVWNILNDLDFEKAMKTDIDEKFFFIDHDFMGRKGETPTTFVEQAKHKVGERRLIKSHLPLGLLPPDLLKKAKVVYVGRNPKDVVISYYHHHKLTRKADHSITFEEFLPFFMKELLEEDPYLSHIKEAVKVAQTCPNILFLWYEDMKRDLKTALKEVSSFLGVTLDQAQVESLANYLDFKNMKKNPAVNHQDRHERGRFLDGESFIRKGVAGGWRETFTEPLNTKFDKWLEENTKDVQIDFKWD